MRISDWSSDVCSSDLGPHRDMPVLVGKARLAQPQARRVDDGRDRRHDTALSAPDRKSVVSGKSVSVRVDLGGRRIIKKKQSVTAIVDLNYTPILEKHHQTHTQLQLHHHTHHTT